jgi:CheY-like chemotaxis protein
MSTQNDTNARKERPRSGSRALAGVRVLLAEDGPVNRHLTVTLLQRGGAEVDVANDGREAVEKATAGSYDVILMDVQMPEMDGYAATGALRRRGYEGPILALTARDAGGDRERSLRAGCDGHLAKPIRRGNLFAAVRQAAGGPPPREAAG